MNKNKNLCIGNSVKPGESYFHPLYLKLYKNTSNENICPSNIFQLDKNKININRISNKSFTKDELNKFMLLPNIDIDSSILLYSVYNIYDVDDLIKYVNKSIEDNLPFKTINRLINIWSLNNIDDILKNHSILIKIFYKLFTKYWKKIEISDNKFKSESNTFIEKYKQKHDDFNFDIGMNLYKYLRKI